MNWIGLARGTWAVIKWLGWRGLLAALGLAVAVFLALQVQTYQGREKAAQDALEAAQAEIRVLSLGKQADTKAVIVAVEGKKEVKATYKAKKEEVYVAIESEHVWADEPIPAAIRDSLRVEAP